MNPSQQKTLTKIAGALNSENIVWGVGASMLLAQYGLVDNPADIDIVVNIENIAEADKLLSSLGSVRKQKEKSDIYLTDFFYEYAVDSVEIDAMAGFKIKLQNSVFEYIFDEESIPHFFRIGHVDVPFMALEDWYVLYQLMPNREHKANLLENYFSDNGIEHPTLLKRMQDMQTLPAPVAERIKKLIGKED